MSEADPHLLILETSGRTGWVAVARGPRLLAAHKLEESRRHARDLAPVTQELLAGLGWKAADLAGVIVSRGPGSYTGLRVGLMSAMTLAYATGCALLALDTFAVVAQQAPAGLDRLDVLADAQQENVYFQPFARQGERWVPLADLAIVRFHDWLARRLEEGGASTVSGPGLLKWEAKLPAEVVLVPPEAREPLPEALLALGLARYNAGERDDIFAVEPLYLRPSAAEEQWRRLGK